MTAAAERNRSQSFGIMAIVGGVVFSTVAAVIVAIFVLLLYLGYRQVRDTETAANKKDQHVRDTGSAGPIENVQPVGGGGRRVRTDGGGENSTRDPNARPPPGPVSLIVSDEKVFLSIEVNCPGGYRARGNFRKHGSKEMKATVQRVPSDEMCTATFQGSEPAKVRVSGNQTKRCTFNPVDCHFVY